ncbi:ferredoxin-like protein FixX [Propionicimonas paludicola]|uniref:Ferredoxin-like protein FixX n=1 Tax=Propionicimonas paludicola TaxID=185243 RepID=A0A2A9CRU1_9ACTN|nr:4Fe-4S dicluster domain-containing protein [Propionicimonas paludicola]PFG17144.1 ferredoxin-like protein FixX [Propionicimonas paludicola]
MSLESKLAVDRFAVDEESAHITLADTSGVPRKTLELLVRGCPAGLYRLNDDGSLDFDYAGCFECGTCYVLAHGTALASWYFPRGEMGIEYRRG